MRGVHSRDGAGTRREPLAHRVRYGRVLLTDDVGARDGVPGGQQLPHAALRGMPTRAKIEELHLYWFDTGHPLVVELSS